MTKAQFLTLLRQTASVVNPQGQFIYARPSDQSLEYDSAQLQTGAQIMVDPLPVDKSVYNPTGQTEAYNLTIAFLVKDTQDSTNGERESIEAQAMDLLCDQFFDQLDKSDDVEIGAIRTQPLYRVMAACLTGVAATVTVTTAKGCTIAPEYIEPTEGIFAGVFE